MPCNLAITITKAAVSEERLRALLTPEVVTSLLASYLQASGYAIVPESFQQQQPGTYASLQTLPDGRVQCRIGGYYGIDVFVAPAGVVTVNTTTYSQHSQADHVLADVTQLLSQATDALFARQVQAALASLGVPMTTEQVQVDQAGHVSPATVFTLRVS